MEKFKDIKGRGTSSDPQNRFEKLHLEQDLEDFVNLPEEDKPKLTTQFFYDSSKSIISENDSPDLGFSYSMNPYCGCEHGCIYCYARPTHEYLGFSAGLDFESKILIKKDAPELLRKKVMSKLTRLLLCLWSGWECIGRCAKRECFRQLKKCVEENSMIRGLAVV